MKNNSLKRNSTCVDAFNEKRGKKEAERALHEVFNDVEELNIDYILYDVLILKAECLNNPKLLSYCESIERKLFKIKNGEAVLK